MSTEAIRLAAWMNKACWHKMCLGDFEAAGRELLRLAAEVDALRSERTAWQVTAENAEAALTLTDETTTQLREQVAALEPDAARYRWLRAQHWEENKLGVVVRPKDNAKLGCFLPSDTLLDNTIDHMSAIDESMKEQS